MKINVRADSVHIEGYVNAVERNSKPLFSRFGKFVEKIVAGAFGRALKRNKDVRILLNHDWDKNVGGTGTGELRLTEDTIGLHAEADITDAQVVKDAKEGNLVGWSFGFRDRDVVIMQDAETGLPLRSVRDLDLLEVSLLNREKTPAYIGTLVNVRDADGNDTAVNIGDTNDEAVEVIVEGATDDITDDTKEYKPVTSNDTALRADEITTGSLPTEATPAEVNTDTKSYDNSKYINIVTELKTMRDSV